jgi:hypothetical protein
MLRGLEELWILSEDIEHGGKVQTQRAGIALALAPLNLLYLVSMLKLFNGYISIDL